MWASPVIKNICFAFYIFKKWTTFLWELRQPPGSAIPWNGSVCIVYIFLSKLLLCKSNTNLMSSMSIIAKNIYIQYSRLVWKSQLMCNALNNIVFVFALISAKCCVYKYIYLLISRNNWIKINNHRKSDYFRQFERNINNNRMIAFVSNVLHSRNLLPFRMLVYYL